MNQYQHELGELIQVMSEDQHPNIVLNITNESRIARSEQKGREWFRQIVMTGAAIQVTGGDATATLKTTATYSPRSAEPPKRRTVTEAMEHIVG